jgi:streptogramin lyase
MRMLASSVSRFALSLCLFFASIAAASAALVFGPTYPLPNVSGLVTQTGTIGRSGGATWTFNAAVPTAQQSLWWAPAPNGVQLSFVNNAYANPGETLFFSSGQSNLGIGLVVYTGQTKFADGAPSLTRFTMNYQVGGSAVALVLAPTLGLDANTLGVVLPLSTPASGFTVNMRFDATDGGGFAPALDIFDAHLINNQECCVQAFSSMTGGYYVDTTPQITNVIPTRLVIQKSSTSPTVAFTVSDVDSAPTTLTVTATSDNTAVIANTNIVLAGTTGSRTLTVTSTATPGSANITLTVSDGLKSSTAVLSVRVNAIPILNVNAPLGVNQGSNGTITLALLRATDPDTAIPPTFVVQGQPHDGTLFLNGVASPASFTQADVNAGNVTYTHSGSCNTSDNFQFEVEDVDGGFANDPAVGPGPTSYNFNFNITQAQTAPITQSASYSLALGGTVTANLVATSTDCSNPAKTFQIATQPTNGIVSVDTNSGSFTYTANTGYSGADSFTYTATTYGNMVSAPATISFNIQTQAPVAQSATISTNEGAAVSGTLTATDANLPASALTYALATLPAKGGVVLNDANTGSFTYTPNAGAIGQDSFTFTAFNGTLTSAPATITINVRAKLHAGELVVADQGDATHPASLVLFDPASQQQALISDDPQLSSGNSPIQVAVGADGKILVSVNNKILQVDPADGSATVFATGFGFSLGVAVAADGNVLVADPGMSRIVRLNGTTGAQIGAPISLGVAPGGIAVADDTSLYVSDVAAAFGGPSNFVYHLNADGTGVTTLTSGDNLSAPLGIAFDNGNLFVSNASFGPGGTNDVIHINTTTGAQTILTSGGSISNASGISFDATRLYVISQNTAAVIGVDPATGAQTPQTSGGYLHVPFAISNVSLRASVTTITSELPDPSVPGGNYAVSVSVAPTFGSGTPSGTVAVSDGAGATCIITLVNGSGSCNLASVAPGTVMIAATYSGDIVFALSATTASHLVGSYPTTTTITSPLSSVVGESYAINVTVTAPTGTPAGTISVTDTATTPNTCGPVTLSGGSATCNITWTVPGSYALRATYTPGTPTQYAASTSLGKAHTVTKGGTAVAVTPASGSVTINNPYTVNVTVGAASPATGTPTGSVSVSDGGSDTCTISSLDIAGVGSCQLTPTSVGSKTITATYGGDANFNGNSGTAGLIVNQATSINALASSLNPSTFGQSVTFTATVTGQTPTGTVTFKDGATTMCNAVALTAGAVTCATSTLSVATHLITAVYSGDTNNTGSSSNTVSQVTGQASSSTVLVSGTNPSTFGQSVTVTATVTGQTPTGTVTFKDGASAIAGCSSASFTGGTSNSPSAVCATAALSTGTHSITSVYSGDASNSGSTSSPVSQVVNRSSTTTTLSTNCEKVFVQNQPFTLAAAVSGTNNPTGTVTFFQGAAPVCSSVGLISGSASCTVSDFTAAGSYSLTANYGGNTNNAPSNSGPMRVTVLSAADVIFRNGFEPTSLSCPIE